MLHDAGYGYIQTPTQTETASDYRERGNCNAHSLLLRLDVSSRNTVFQAVRKMSRLLTLPSLHYRICTTFLTPAAH